MGQNLLKLYDGKTDINIIGESCITLGRSVKDLGVTIDTILDEETSVCRAVYYHLKNIHSLKQTLS